MLSQTEKALKFQQLHQQQTAFIIPNPWDIGTATLLGILGFQALATTSAGYAFARGLADGKVGLNQTILHVAEIASATDLPVSADLENGFGDSPEQVANAIRLAADAGAVGGSIEDTTGHDHNPIYNHALAVERVQAAAEAKRNMSFPFVLTARAENYIVGREDLGDTIKRLQAYQEAGADVVFAPGVKKKEDIAAVVSSVDIPVNVIMGFPDVNLSLDDLSALGVKRLSVGGSLARAALGAFLRAAKELKDQGTFTYATGAVSSKEINALFSVRS